MKTFGWSLANVVLLLSLLSAQGKSGFPRPPAPLGQITVTNNPNTTHVSHLDTARLQHEAAELSALAQSVQSDIGSINRGLLPKDTIDKLKRIEKISKHLRSEIVP